MSAGLGTLFGEYRDRRLFGLAQDEKRGQRILFGEGGFNRPGIRESPDCKAALFIIRILGKRTVGNTSAFDLIVALMLGEVVDEAIFGDVSMVKGLLAITVIAAWHLVNAWASFKSKRLEALTESTPTVLVDQGVIQHEALAKERLNEDELWSELRLMSVEDLEEVKKATLEPNGKVSVLKQDWARPVEKGDLPGQRRKATKGA